MAVPHKLWVAFASDTNAPYAVALTFDECDKASKKHYKERGGGSYLREFVQSDGEGNRKNPTLSELMRMVADKMEED